MTRLHHWKFATVVMLVLSSVLALSACSSGVKSQSVAKAKAAGAFDVVLQAYKDGQFLLDGAILSSQDLSSHFEYMKNQGHLPQTVLLERSKKYKIGKDNLRYMASMALTYGFKVYFAKGGKLRQILPTAANKTKLKGSPPPTNKSHPELERHSAAHGRMDPNYGGH